ncbi:MAG TPA: flavodoxin domain-containing protein [Geobacteraceae bacterium]|nr:flavodoxin domain-containing protein [Geobacteraceae bacterium]
MKNKKLTRRDFLKISGLTLGGSILTCLGLNSLASRSLEDETAKLETTEFAFGEKNDKSLLIAYATYAGSTMEVASAIGEELGARGYRVDVKPITKTLQVDGYQAVIIGSAVQYGEWLPEAVDFVKTNQQSLEKARVALFSVHIQNLEDDPTSRAARLAYLDGVRPFVQAEAEVFFAGRFDKRGAALLLPKLIAWIMPDMDLRDWTKIRAWAQTILAQKLSHFNQGSTYESHYHHRNHSCRSCFDRLDWIAGQTQIFFNALAFKIGHQNCSAAERLAETR